MLRIFVDRLPMVIMQICIDSNIGWGGDALRGVSISRKPIATAKYEDGDDLRLFELVRVYDGSGDYGVCLVDANGSMRDYHIRFDGSAEAAYALFAIWAKETYPTCRVVRHDVPRQTGRDRPHAQRRSVLRYIRGRG